MNNLPIPTSPRGWSTAILILLLLFGAYYGWFFADLQSFYKGKLFCEQKGQETRVIIDVPKYVAPSGQRWVYVKFRNQQSFPLRDVSIWLDVQREDKTLDRQNMPFLFGTSVAKPDVLIFEQIPPSGTVHGRLPLFIANPTTSTITVTVWVSSTVLPEPISASVSGEVQVNPWHFLAHSFIEQILLPPWSNGLIVLLVFAACALVDKRFSDTEAGRRREWWREWWDVFYPSFMLVSFLTGVAFILPYLPWLFSWSGFRFGWIGIPVVLILVYLRRRFARFAWSRFRIVVVIFIIFILPWLCFRNEACSWITAFVFLLFMGWWTLESLNLGSSPFFEDVRSWIVNFPLIRRWEKIGPFRPLIIPLVFFVLGWWICRSYLSALLLPLLPILVGATAVKFLAILFTPKPPGGENG